MSSPTFTGRTKRRTTRASVLVAERVARLLISIGGVGTILAVSLIFVFLLWVVAPLFGSAELRAEGRSAATGDGARTLALGIDEDRTLRWALDSMGRLALARIDTGEVLDTDDRLRIAAPAGGGPLLPASVALAPAADRFAVGYEDGRVLLGVVGFASTVLAEIDPDVESGSLGRGVEVAPAELRGLPDGELRSFEGGLVSRMSERKLVRRELSLRTLDPVRLFDGVGVRLVASGGELAFPEIGDPKVAVTVAGLSASGRLAVRKVTQRIDFMTGEASIVARGAEFDGAVPQGAAFPSHLFISGLGDHVLLLWPDGRARHFLFRGGSLELADELDLLPHTDGKVSACAAVLGQTSLLVGDTGGSLAAWFPARPDTSAQERVRDLAVREYQTRLYELRELLEAAGVPPYQLPFSGVEAAGLDGEVAARLGGEVAVEARRLVESLLPLAAAVESARSALVEADRQRFVRGPFLPELGQGYPTALQASARSRLAAVGTSSGEVALVQVTSADLLALIDLGQGSVDALALAPKENGVVAWLDGGYTAVEADPGHPEATVRSLFKPVAYEGEATPSHTWQSTGGSDSFEPKLGLMPLVFGTLKATFYSMLFGAPLALLAAIYSSEFLAKRLRAPLKALLELMASLPSVVLGFLAALVIAPFVQDVLPSLLAFFFVLPFTLVLGANAWQLMPRRRAILWGGWQRFAAICVALVASIWLSALLGPAIEALFFAGNLELWLDGQLGDGAGGWLLLFLPLSALVVFLGLLRYVDPWLRIQGRTWSHSRTTRVELIKFVGAAAMTIGLALLLAEGTTAAGFDPRGHLVDTYVQRNALVVGFVMGFAIIPIIYTLADDALTSVPAHLRLASLGCGATPWQTAIRVIVPTAMSGLFSAVMIGLGRAVGETMIVLMAAGNTPVMEWNVFNGFRTLSANIAVELPEAARDTTHYRVLFLAALTLFMMTFVLNTMAEVVRARFRKRAFQL